MIVEEEETETRVGVKGVFWLDLIIGFDLRVHMFFCFLCLVFLILMCFMSYDTAFYNVNLIFRFFCTFSLTTLFF